MASSWPSVTVEQETVYLAHATDIVALRLSDGVQVWRFPEKADNSKLFYAAPALAGDQVLVGDYSNVLHSLNAENGLERWTFNEAKGRYVAPPLVVDDRILAPSADHNLYALDLQGNLRWKFQARHALWAQPASDGERVYQPSMDHFLYALQLSTGNLLWSLDLGGAMVYQPALDENGILYVGTLTNEMVAVDGQNGNELWRYATAGGVWSKPVVHEGVLYFGDQSGAFYALDAANGSLKWKLESEGSIIASPVLLPDGLVYVVDNGEVYHIGFNGQQIWPRTISGKLYGSPVVAGERIVVPVLQGEKLLMAFDLEGNQTWSYAPSK